MCDARIVICFKSAFNKKPHIFIRNSTGYLYTQDVLSLDCSATYYSYGHESIIDEYREREVKDLPLFFDIVTARKLLSGKPKSDFKKGSEPWSLKSLIAKRVNPKTVLWVDDVKNYKMPLDSDGGEFANRKLELLDGMSGAWCDVLAALESEGEEKRFFEVEVPIHNLFLKTQLFGIKTPQENLNQKIVYLKRQYYSKLKKIELDYNFRIEDVYKTYRWSEISDKCSLRNIEDDINTDFWKYVEVYSDYDEFLDLLISAKNLYTDYSVLLKYTVDGYEKIYPKFNTLGTVTGRVLVDRPGIQYLKKTSRDIFVPNDGNELLYADFSQFEPGIVASVSKDKKLLDIYNSGDIYCHLSELLFGTVEERKTSKIILLAFLYGMSRERLLGFISNFPGASAEEAVNKFFGEFKRLHSWKNEVCDEAKANGYSSSLYGNKRYLSALGSVNKREERWVPNQIIQGTASYIFKKALIDLSKKNIVANFLIPMHDAILVETPKSNIQEVKKQIKESFNGAFRQVCPELKTSVTFDDFAE